MKDPTPPQDAALNEPGRDLYAMIYSRAMAKLRRKDLSKEERAQLRQEAADARKELTRPRGGRKS